jgi:hypothetical protein
MTMRALGQTRGKPLAVSLLSAENHLYEAKRKTDDHGRSRGMARGSHRQDDGQVFSRRAREAVSRSSEDHRRREEARSRQAFTIFSSCLGSSPDPSARIARTKSSSRAVAKSPRITSRSSFSRFLALASCGRRPRLFSSAITSRMSSSFVPFAMSKDGNDGRFLTTFQLTSSVASRLRLTRAKPPAYTVDSRWARYFARRASSHSACTASQSGLPAGISEICNRSGSL